MKSEEINNLLEKKHKELFEWLENQPHDSWEKGPENRWTVGQHFLHLHNSMKMLNKALALPKFLLKYKFGISNRPSRSYEEVAKRYETKLSENLDRAKRFNQNMEIPSVERKKDIVNSIQIQNKKLQFKTRKLKDKHFDKLLLPHPLMGKMTLREIIMWTAHHTEHHCKILQKDYS